MIGYHATSELLFGPALCSNSICFSGRGAADERRDVGAGPLERGPRGLQERQADRPARRREAAQPRRHLHPQHGHLRQLVHAGHYKS